MTQTQVQVFDIDYDTDQPESLPIRFIWDIPQAILAHKDMTEELEEWIADKISDDTGFCHKGFNYEVLSNQTKSMGIQGNRHFI